jgi:hypothetical protein
MAAELKGFGSPGIVDHNLYFHLTLFDPIPPGIILAGMGGDGFGKKGDNPVLALHFGVG